MKEQNFIDIDSLLSLFVAEYSTPLLHFVNTGTLVSEAKKKIDDLKIHHLPVFRDAKLVGIITAQELMCDTKNSTQDKVEDVMDFDPYIVSGEEGLDEVIEQINLSVHDYALVRLNSIETPLGYGILTTSDALNAFIAILRGDIPIGRTRGMKEEDFEDFNEDFNEDLDEDYGVYFEL